jgi:hypothetical protein
MVVAHRSFLLLHRHYPAGPMARPIYHLCINQIFFEMVDTIVADITVNEIEDGPHRILMNAIEDCWVKAGDTRVKIVQKT